MVADKVTEVCLLGKRARRILIHIEIQAQRDPALTRRMHGYHRRIRETYGLPVASLVLLADEHPYWRPSGFRQQVQDTVEEFAFGTAKLLDYAADLDALEASSNPIAWVTLAHRRTQQAHRDPDNLYAAKLHLTRLLFKHRWSRRRIIVLFNVINWMMALPESYERRYGQAVERMGKELGMKKLYNAFEQMLVNDGIKVGLERGLEQGLEQGRKEGAIVVLERMLVQRFGPLPQTVRKKLAQASLAQLEAWSDALAAAQSLQQVFR